MKKQLLILATLLPFTVTSNAAEFEVGQKNKKFTTSELSISIGDTVSFPNHDPFFHNVFSLSEVKSFDLGSYKKGQTKKIIFEKPGVIEVECAIHPRMRMNINVK